jgi:glutathione synthase/RimK-type ligase-like ATP-grasp enzyme
LAQERVDAIFRVAAAGEWRTKVALGGVRRAVADPPAPACELALAAARATGAALVGVDLVPDGEAGWTVLELNGAFEFTRAYQPAGDVFVDVVAELVRAAVAELAVPRSATAAG